MSFNVMMDIDEDDVARAIRSGDLRLEHILQDVFTDEAMTRRLIKDMEVLNGTRRAGELAQPFITAMIES